MKFRAAYFSLFMTWLLLYGACQPVRSNPNMVLAENTTPKVDTLPEAEDMTDSFLAILNLDYVMGRFNPAEHPDFTLIDTQYADKPGMYLRKDAYRAFLAMYSDALKDGIRLRIRSATRNFYAQKAIWEGKWTGERLIESGENLALTTPDPKERALKILRFSSMPGSSRHHWGTDVDLNNLDNSWFEEGEGLNMYNWLVNHAHRYGFCQPYSAGRPYGYWEERWHWSYMPVSERLTSFAAEKLKNEMITGFLGSETAPMIDIVQKYVLGINEACK